MRAGDGGRAGAVLAGYALVAGVWTWPLVLHLTTAIPGDGKDGWQETWDLWWFARALGSGQNPFHTNLLFHPGGADLYLHSLQPFNGLIALPAQLLGGPILAYNFAIFFSLIFSAAGAYWLARDRLGRAGALSPGPWGALPPFAAGLLFGFSPYMADHLLSHLNLVAAEGLPFAVLALLHCAEDGGWESGIRGWQALPWRWIIGAALVLLATGLCDWQYVLFLAIWTALWAIADCGLRIADWARKRRNEAEQTAQSTELPAPGNQSAIRNPQSAMGWLGPALAWALFLLLVSPLAVGMVGQLAGTATSTISGLAQETLTYSADVLAYLIPSPFHPWWGAVAAEWLRPFPGTLIEKVMFPTYTGLALAGLGWFVGRRCRWPVGGWAAMAGAFGILSLGPYLHIGGQQLPVPLPAWLLYQLPVANLTRAPGRFVILVLLALAVLAAFGLAALLRAHYFRFWILDFGSQRSGQNYVPKSKIQNLKWIALAAVALLGVELWVAPYRLATWDVPAATATLADLPPGWAVYDVPVKAVESAYMQAQIVHLHPLIGGYLARAPAYPLLDGVPVFTQLATLRDAPDLCAPPLDGLGPGLFAYFTTGALVLHKDKLDDRGLTAARDLAARAGLGVPVVENDRLVMYRPPLTGTVAPWANLEASTWYDQETTPGGGPLRWMNITATIDVWRPAVTTATLRLQAYSFVTARRIAVTLDNRSPTVVMLAAAPGPLTIPLPPASGRTVITLRALDPPVSPASLGQGSDLRPLSLALTGCTLNLR